MRKTVHGVENKQIQNLILRINEANGRIKSA